ncbi:GCG_CRPN prefix-to-repeats domain-containing protein [Methylobacterium sp. ID0610]|uniref:GCG_CRPN prefix-to-repeats domain-containing protein n=1 Tax=Methylobacterium carpenticola TaxID=3344827 RepID=UPI00367A72FB
MTPLRLMLLAALTLGAWLGTGSLDQGRLGVATAQAAGGCGIGFHRGPYGGCRPNVYGGYYGAPGYYGYRGGGYGYRGGGVYGYRGGAVYGGRAYRGGRVYGGRGVYGRRAGVYRGGGFRGGRAVAGGGRFRR